MTEPTHAGPAEFDVFYRREYSRVVAVARVLSPTLSAAEDLAQEAFVSAHRHWAKISNYDSPGGWVRRVLINKATSLRRRLLSESNAVGRMEATLNPVAPDVSAETGEIWSAVRRLPKRQAQAIALFYAGDMSVSDVASVMECSRGAVKTHLHRGRQRLEETLEDWRGQP